MEKKQWIVYLVRCSDESLYCGITNNLINRLTAHNSGRGARYTKFRRPVELVGTSSEMTKSNALKLEYRVKQVGASKKKFELTKGEDNTMATNLKKELQSLRKEVKTLQTKLEKLPKEVKKLQSKLEKFAKEYDKQEKAKAAKKSTAKKKAVAKKKTAPKKRVTSKRKSPAKKKTTPKKKVASKRKSPAKRKVTKKSKR